MNNIPELTTLCYIEKDDKYLMMHRVKKKNDINKDKWIGIGGHLEGTESPEECLLREAMEETGLRLTSYRMRGIVTFVSGDGCLEYMALYTADGYEGEIGECNEGTLEWVEKDKVYDLNLWEGDKIFFLLLERNLPFFSLKLVYDGHGILTEAALDGKKMELLDLLDEETLLPNGIREERNVAHRTGNLHSTVHMWVVRTAEKNSSEKNMSEGMESESDWEILVQKRSSTKDSNPGCYDISSAGHISAGQEPDDAAVRELEEELGIKASLDELTPCGYTLRKSVKPFYDQFWTDYQKSYIYLYEKDVDIAKLHLQEEEVESVGWMRLSDIIKKVEANDGTFPHCFNLKELYQIRESLISS